VAGGYLHTTTSETSVPTATFRSPIAIKDVIKTGGEWVSSLELETSSRSTAAYPTWR